MRENYFVAVRKATKARLVGFIKDSKDLDRHQIVARFSAATGYSYKKINEYIEELLAEGRITEKDLTAQGGR